MMKINIYYGGRGLIEDSTIYVINKLTEVLADLRVEVVRYNLYEEKNNISLLPKTLKDANGVILAVSMEWMGIGGYMQQFLDACWLYADKEHMKSLYMLPVVIASNYGEREAECTLVKAWEMLGGIPVSGLCAYVKNHIEFETNPEYAAVIEKKAEMFYRNVNQKKTLLPSSAGEVKRSVLKNQTVELTPQESEQLSVYVSDDKYVKKQKEDIEELAQLFKGMLGEETEKKPEEGKPEEPAKSEEPDYIQALKQNFKASDELKATYVLQITDLEKSLVVEVEYGKLNCYYGSKQAADVVVKVSAEVLTGIIHGRMTLQRAFMSGDLTAKGNFKTLRAFDMVFQFKKI